MTLTSVRSQSPSKAEKLPTWRNNLTAKSIERAGQLVAILTVFASVADCFGRNKIGVRCGRWQRGKGLVDEVPKPFAYR
jgi:hypothetical protein